MGLRPLFDDMVVRLARDYSWSVAAVEPFPGRESMTLDERMAAMAGLDDARHLADIAAAADLLATPRVAILGFCMGGMYTMKAAATGRFDRAAPFYGMIRVPEAWRGPAQRAALDPPEGRPPTPSRAVALLGTARPYNAPKQLRGLQGPGATGAR